MPIKRLAHIYAVCALCLLAHLAQADEKPSTILVLGDSLSAGYGIDVKQGWVNLLQERLAENYPHQVINASVSGETSGGGLARLPALLEEHQPMLVVVELGGNDGLRGHPINVIQQHLERIIQKTQTTKARVLLLGMQIPPNYGSRYAQLFQKTYTQLADKYHLAYVDFFLDGVAGTTTLMQRDGIHPTAEAQILLLDNVWPKLEPLLSH